MRINVQYNNFIIIQISNFVINLECMRLIDISKALNVINETCHDISIFSNS